VAIPLALGSAADAVGEIPAECRPRRRTPLNLTVPDQPRHIRPLLRGEVEVDRFAEMEAFIRVVDASSFSSAARQMHIGQPAVSKTIAQLEDRLGVRLLLRSTRGLVPTEAGRSFYDRAKRSIEEAVEAELAARGAAATLSGRLRICAAVTFARLHLVPRLPAFLAKHPALDVDVLLSDGEVDLIEAGVDVALRISPLRDSSLTGRKIACCERRVVGTPAFFEANGVPRTPAELMARQAIIYEVYERRLGSPTWTFQQGTVEASVTLTGRVHVTAAEGVREAVLAGLGFAIASEWMFAPELKSGAVVSVLDDWSLPLVDLWVLFPAGRQASAKARAFAEFIESEVPNASWAAMPPRHDENGTSGDTSGSVEFHA
jgi:DNA-binding transcriptional LysR family regulator